MKADRELLKLAELKRCLSYDEATGEFTWLVRNSNCIKVGSRAGKRTNSDGYLDIQVNNKMYKAHRLAWFYCTGEWPNQIDHINGIRTDNRICNLRSVTSKLNANNQRPPHRTNSLGVLGVVKRPSGRFAAEIRVSGKKLYIGTYDTITEASNAYKAKKLELHEGAVP